MTAARAGQRVLRSRRPDVAGALTVAWRRRSGEPSLAVMERLVRPGDLALDIGANWGLYAWLLSRRVGPEGFVHSFEPHPTHAETLRWLERRSPNLTVHLVGLSDREGSAVLEVPVSGGRSVTALARLASGAGGDGSAADRHERVAVRTARLDDILGQDGPPVDFVKCDVEGHEGRVLRGGQATFSRSLPTLMVEIEQRHHDDDITPLLESLTAMGYSGWCLRSGGLGPLANFDVQRDQLQFLRPGLVEYEMPEAYVADFLFARPEVDVERALMAPLI